MSGRLRIRGAADHPYLLAPQEVTIEVQQDNGGWMPLRCVCSAEISIRPDRIVTARMEVELSEVDIINPGVVVIPTSLLQRVRWWWRLMRARSRWRA